MLEIYARNINVDSLRDIDKFLTLDIKLLATLKDEFARRIFNHKEEVSKGHDERGRQGLFIFDQFFKIKEGQASPDPEKVDESEKKWEMDFKNNLLIRHLK